MIYLLEANLEKDKKLEIALKEVYGINSSKSKMIRKILGFSENAKVGYLTELHFSKIQKLVEKKKIITGSELRHKERLHNKKLVSVKSYRGLRKLQGLPVRGQRTHSNARSARKKKK